MLPAINYEAVHLFNERTKKNIALSILFGFGRDFLNYPVPGFESLGAETE